MTSYNEYTIVCLVKADPEDPGQWQEFDIEAESGQTLGTIVLEFLAAFQQQVEELPEDERSYTNIFIDDEADLDQAVTVTTADEMGNDVQVPLDIPPAELGYPDGTQFVLQPGRFIVGVRIFSRKKRSERPSPARGRSTPAPSPPPVPAAPSAEAAAAARTRKQRIRNEVEDFLSLLDRNSDLLELISPSRDEIANVWQLAKPLVFAVHACGWAVGDGGEPVARDRHVVKLSFPPGYPTKKPFKLVSVPTEPPIFHPNVNPVVDEDGAGHYICLYTDDVEPSKRYVAQALAKLEALIQWRTGNLDTVDAMNKRAAELFGAEDRTMHDRDRPRLRSLGLTLDGRRADRVRIRERPGP